MKIKQRVIMLSENRYGGFSGIGYNNLVDALNDGWIVKRMDYLYNHNGNIASNLYILEKEDEK